MSNQYRTLSQIITITTIRKITPPHKKAAQWRLITSDIHPCLMQEFFSHPTTFPLSSFGTESEELLRCLASQQKIVIPAIPSFEREQRSF
jgi:hypothetical protein